MRNPKILLVGVKLNHRSFNGANKALPVLASALHNANFSNVVQMDLERKDISINDVCKEATDSELIVFAGCLTPQFPEIDFDTKTVFEYLKKIGKSIPIIVGGYATKNIEDVARETPWVNAWFNGEGEEAIVKIVETISKGTFKQEMPKIQGICFIDETGKFHYSLSPRVKNFDSINQNFELVHVPQVYDMDIFKINGKQLKTAQIFTQRGCPWNCGYCNKSTEGTSITRLSPESFRKQLKQLYAQGFRAVYLDVDTFTYNKEAAKTEARILQEEGFIWGTNTRIDAIDLESMKYFVTNDCVYMFFGVEHTLPEVTLAIGKFNGAIENQIRKAWQYPEKVKEVFKNMRLAGLPSSYFIILGLPKAIIKNGKISGFEPTTFEDDIQTIKFGLEECEPNYLNFNMLRFMPGSLAADVVDKNGEFSFACVRPSGKNQITAGWFLPRVAKKLGYKVPINHGVYRLCESVGMNQPTTIAVNKERVYNTIKFTMELINKRLNEGKNQTALFIDKEIIDKGLVKRDNKGRYEIASLNEFDSITDEIKELAH